MTDLRIPNITGRNDSEKIAQLERYLRQMVQELNYALRELERLTKEGGSSK